MGGHVSSGGLLLHSLSRSPKSVTRAYWERGVVARSVWGTLDRVL
jgi:hypothetical protein